MNESARHISGDDSPSRDNPLDGDENWECQARPSDSSPRVQLYDEVLEAKTGKQVVLGTPDASRHRERTLWQTAQRNRVRMEQC